MEKTRDLTAMLLRIEKSSMHDGAGLRTVVFLKGCNLRCRWCSTPESQRTEVELGFDAALCLGCGACANNCPGRALSRPAGGRIAVEPGRCRRCWLCRDICPQRALFYYGREASVAEVLDTVLKDEVFYFYSGGGVTVSGGEPLLQADFVTELLKRCKSQGLNTAVETNFCLPWSMAAQPLPYLDTLFVDIKHSDSGLHEQLTGAQNNAVLENITLADNSPLPFGIVIRLPLIPGLNDDEPNLSKTAALAASLTKLKYLEILPYHRLGSGAYAKLGRDYALQNLSAPGPAYVAEKCAFIKSCQPKLEVRY